MLMEFATASVSSSRVYFSLYFLFAMCRGYRRGSDNSPFWCGPGNRKASEAEVRAEPGDVAGGLDVVVGPGDLPGRIDHEGGPDHADSGLPVQLLLAPGAVGIVHLVLRVGPQREVQPVAVTE